MSKESHRLLHVDNRSEDAEASGLEHETQHRPWLQSLKGIIAAFLMVASQTMGVTSVQELQRRIPDLELQAFRCSGVVIACMVWMLIKQELPIVPMPDIPAMALYSLLVTILATATYIGFALVALTTAQCTKSTFELLCGLYIFWLCRLERFSLLRVVFVMLCVAGVLLVIQPWHTTFPKSVEKSIKNYSSGDCVLQMEKLCPLKSETDSHVNSTSCEIQTHNEPVNPCENLQLYSEVVNTNKRVPVNCSEWFPCWFSTAIHDPTMTDDKQKENKVQLFQIVLPQKYNSTIGILFAALGGIAHALVCVVLKKCPSVKDNVSRSLFWSFLLTFCCSVILTFIVESPVWPQASFDALLVSLHSLSAVFTWVFWACSLQCISATALNVIYSTAVVFMLIPQYTLLASILPGQRNWMEVVGVFLVLGGSVSVSVLEVLQATDNTE